MFKRVILCPKAGSHLGCYPMPLIARPEFPAGAPQKCCNPLSTGSIAQVPFRDLADKPQLLLRSAHCLPVPSFLSTPGLAPKQEQSFSTSKETNVAQPSLKEKALQCPSHASEPALTITGVSNNTDCLHTV